jgi:hypothetical protein
MKDLNPKARYIDKIMAKKNRKQIPLSFAFFLLEIIKYCKYLIIAKSKAKGRKCHIEYHNSGGKSK